MRAAMTANLVRMGLRSGRSAAINTTWRSCMDGIASSPS